MIAFPPMHAVVRRLPRPRVTDPEGTDVGPAVDWPFARDGDLADLS